MFTQPMNVCKFFFFLIAKPNWKTNRALFFSSQGLKLSIFKKIHGDSKRTGYFCDKCDKFFLNELTLKSHRRIHNSDDCPYKCAECKRGFSTCVELKRHCQTTADGFPCDECDGRFKYRCIQTKHYRTQHLDLMFKCEHCGKLLKYKNSLVKHLKQIHGT